MKPKLQLLYRILIDKFIDADMAEVSMFILALAVFVGIASIPFIMFLIYLFGF